MARSERYSDEENLKAAKLLGVDFAELLSLRTMPADEAREVFAAFKVRVRRNYREQLRALHPDRNGGVTPKLFQLIRDWGEALDDISLEALQSATLPGSKMHQLHILDGGK